MTLFQLALPSQVSSQQVQSHAKSARDSGRDRERGDSSKRQRDVSAVLLDMDGTMIGRILPSVCEYELLRQFDPKKLAAFKQQLVSRLRYGPVRPHLEAFCKKAAACGIDVYVYTASEDKWAGVIVPCIERCLGVKFARPIFARSSCVQQPQGDLKKSIERVLPTIHRRMRPRLGGMSIGDLRNRTVLVDNNPSVLMHASEAPRFIKCATYEYLYAYDVLAMLDVDVLHAKFHRVAPVLKKHDLFPENVDASHQTFQQFMATYTKHLADMLGESYRSNQAGLRHDRLFANLQEQLIRPQALPGAAVNLPPPSGKGNENAHFRKSF